MNAPLSRRVLSLRTPASIAAKARADALLLTGRSIVDLTLGEPDFATPPHILEAAAQAMHSGATRYTSSNGTLVLREAIAAKLWRENGIRCTPADVVVGTGAKQIIDVALAATLDDGDEVIVPAPYWVSYPDLVRAHGGTPVILSTSAAEGFRLQAEALAEAITPRTKWLILNTPNNPSGAVLPNDALITLAGVLDRHPHVFVLTDEIYEHFVFGEARTASIAALDPEIAARTLTVNGVSKTYAMTGWRIGYATGPSVLLAAMAKLISQATTCAPAVSQAAAAAALSGPQDCVAEMVAAYAARAATMVVGLTAIDGLRCRMPEGAFYLFPSIEGLLGRRTPDGSTLATDVDVADYLLEAAGVATVDGSAYGVPGFLRLSFATDPGRIAESCRRIAAARADLE
jgi:aspartate aminotransferase